MLIVIVSALVVGQVRQVSGWSETQVRVHIQRLVAMEYLLTHRGGRGQSFEYELLYGGEGETGDSFLMGSAGCRALKCHYDPNFAGLNREFAGPSRPQRGWVAG